MMKRSRPKSELAPSTQPGKTVFRDAPQSRSRGTLFLFFVAVLLIGFALAVSAPAATFTVNSTGDESDAKPGSGICGTLPGVMKTDPDRGPCTLRAAIE